MEARSVDELPADANWHYEPKWDGFRCLAFRDGDEIFLQSKAGQPLARYFPDVVAALQGLDAKRFVLDGGRDSFDPQSLGQARLHNLLWVRCMKAFDAVKAADLLLRDGNFPLVILDLVLNVPEELRKIPQTTWYRLQRLVEVAPTAFLVLTRASILSSAQLKLSLENAWTLADLEQDDLAPRLKIIVKRTQGGRQAMLGAG